MKMILWILILLTTAFAQAENVKIITHEETPYQTLSREQVRDFFLKKTKHWPNGETVRFFDRNDDSAERKVFLRDVVKRSQREVETYWIGQKLYTGNSAPTQVNSDNMMASLVSRFPGSIGYVSGSFAGAPGVKVIEITGN